MSNRYFQLAYNPQENAADVYIYGDITSWPWDESDVSSWGLSRQLSALDPNSDVTVRINSYGGEVAEGIAIYNALKAHAGKVTTVCDGFACSIASVVFMAGRERVMNEASLLMIHNAWTCAAGDSNDLRKQADDLETVTGLSKSIYLAETDLTEEELTEWMDAETFIDPATALERGFATRVEPIAGASQQMRMRIVQRLSGFRAEQPQKQAEEPAQIEEIAAEEPLSTEEVEMRMRIARATMEVQKG